MSITDPTGPTTNLSVASGSGYASLTGTGKTATPGDLTQAGGLTLNIPAGDAMAFKVEDLSGNGAVIDSTGLISLGHTFPGTADFFGITTTSAGPVEIGYNQSALITVNPGAITIYTNNPGGQTANTTTIDSSYLYITGGIVDISASEIEIGSSTSTIGFFGASPIAPQVSGGTLAGVIAGLVALGLFSS